jgi:hypothetical protein
MLIPTYLTLWLVALARLLLSNLLEHLTKAEVWLAVEVKLEYTCSSLR